LGQYSTYRDEQLIDLLRSDNAAAFEELYSRYWQKLFYTAAKKLKNLHEAENIVQDVFLDIWQRRETLQINQTVGGYLAVAIRYRMINLLASKHRAASNNKELIQQATDADNSLHHWLSFRELEHWLSEKVADLPEKCGMAFSLKNQGLTQKEIARTMNISEKTVEMHIGRALKSLRTSFTQLVIFLIICLS
jgi:RNA polymerase sigma-70 factor (family 1)